MYKSLNAYPNRICASLTTELSVSDIHAQPRLRPREPRRLNNTHFSLSIKTMPFKYRPLLEDDSFRLLLISPAESQDARLECSLLHTTLSLCDCDIVEHYVALSYVWGDSSETRKIYIDGYEFRITATLEAALRDLRDPNRALRLWADALCIDQSNIEERGHQVRQMGRIYATAQHTVIYLGPLTTMTESVLRAAASGIDKLQIESVDQIVKLAEKDLLKRPWFRRVWVFQELLLSRNAWVQCGSLRIQWTDLCSFLLSRINSGNLPASAQNISGLGVLTQMQKAREGRVERSLISLLSLRRGLGATDPRDMIFAHLGIVSDRVEIDQDIKINYQQTYRRLYEDVARYLFNSAGPESMFSLVENIDSIARCQGLASWAPDWRLPSSYSPPMYKDNLITVNNLKPYSHYIFTQDPSVLGYLGYNADNISCISPVLPQYNQREPSQRHKYDQTVQKLRALYAKAGGAYMSGDQYGQYVHISLTGYEEEHQQLCREIGEEWLSLFSSFPHPSSPPAAEVPMPSEKAFDSTAQFLARFEEWIRQRATKEIIFAGADISGFEKLMYTYLYSNAPPSVLDGRRIAITQGGRVGVVPAEAREEDAILYFAGTTAAVTFRKLTTGLDVELDGRIKSQFKSKAGDLRDTNSPYVQDFLRLVQDEKTGTIEHGQLVGQCYIEGLIGWVLNVKHEYKIFALH